MFWFGEWVLRGLRVGSSCSEPVRVSAGNKIGPVDGDWVG